MHSPAGCCSYPEISPGLSVFSRHTHNMCLGLALLYHWPSQSLLDQSSFQSLHILWAWCRCLCYVFIFVFIFSIFIGWIDEFLFGYSFQWGTVLSEARLCDMSSYLPMELTLNCFMMPQEEKLGEAEKRLLTNSMYFNETSNFDTFASNCFWIKQR